LAPRYCSEPGRDVGAEQAGAGGRGGVGGLGGGRRGALRGGRGVWGGGGLGGVNRRSTTDLHFHAILTGRGPGVRVHVARTGWDTEVGC